MVVQWPFASFLMTPGAANAFFGAHYHGYDERPDWPDLQNRFGDFDAPWGFAVELTLAVIAAVVTARLGLAARDALGRLRR